MLISARPIRMLLEAMEQTGVDPRPILSVLELDRAALATNEHRIPWSTLVRLCAEVSVAVGGDNERLRAIGHAMSRVESFGSLRRLGGTVLSAEALYDLAERWVGRANFPHLRLVQRFEDDHRFYVHGFIPSSYEGSEAFLQISAGAIEAVPTFLGLPPCERLEARIDARTIDLLLVVPQSRSVFATGRRALGALVRRKQRSDILEGERQLIDAGLSASERSRDELREVLEHMPALIVIHVGGRIVFANRALVRTLGWSNAEDLIGRPLIESIDPRSHAEFLFWSNQPPRADTTAMVEAWLTTRTGDPVLVEATPAQPIVFDGAPARLVVGRDIRERDQLEKRLATADRLAALGLLAAGVAHEVNNPLAYLLNNIEIAIKQLDHLGASAETARNALEIALEGAHRIRFIVRELLLLARDEPTPAAAADVAAAVQSTLALARVEIERTAKLVTEIEPVPPVRGSVPRIAQVILNLVLNSLEAMRDREASENELTVRIRLADARHVLIEIGDNGVGVSSADADRLFLPFFTTKPAGQGTGLGLAVTQRIVTELGGDISFTSERGRGTTFRVILPVFVVERPSSTDLSQRASSSLAT